MRIAMSVWYYSLITYPQTWMGCSQKWELQCLYVYIIPLITYFPNMEGLLTENENCNVCMCILFPWSPISPTWMGSSQKWELQCLYVYIIPLITYFPNMEGLLTEMRIAMSVCVYYSLDHLFPQHGWVAHRNENCNVCMCILFPWSPISPTWRGLLTEMRIAMYICILFPWSPIFPTWRGLLREMRIAMSVCVYYSLDHLFPQHGWVAHSNENCNVYMYIIPLSYYGGGCSRNENCNVSYVYYSLGHLFPQTWRGLLTEMRIAMSVCVYYSLDHLFPQHGGVAHRNENCNVCIVYYSLDHLFSQHGSHRNENCNVCMCILFPWSPISPNMDGVAHRNENCNVCMCILFPWSPISPNMEGVAHRNENCNVCMCILFPWSPISPTWMGSSQKWKLQCLYVYIIPLITYFPNMEGSLTAMRIPMYICILFPWSLISQTWRGLLREMRIAMSVCVYYSLDHLFPQHGWVAHSNENSNVYMYIIPLVTYFPDMEGVAHRNENCNVCMCILFPWSPISPNMEGVAHRNENCNVCMCILFPWSPISQHGWVAHRNENCNVCMCILFPWSPISPTWRGLLTEMRIAMSVCVYYSLDHLFPQTWRGLLTEMRIAMSLYVYIIPLITYFPKHGWVAHRNENCNVCMYIIPLITYFPNMEGVAREKWELQCLMCILFPWSPISPTWRGLLTEMRIAMSVCVYYSLGHLFPQTRRGYFTYNIIHGGGVAHRNENCNVCMCILFPWSPISPTWMGSSQKWKLQCLYVYIIPLITYFPNMEGLLTAMRIPMYICILFPWSLICQTWRGLLREMRIAMSVCVYYSLDHLFPQHGWVAHSNENSNVYMYIIPLITYFPDMEGVAERNENCNVCMCILFPWSPISPTWRGLLTEMRIAMSVCVYVYHIPLGSHRNISPITFPQNGWVAHRNENCNVCMYIIPLITYFPKHGGGCSQKWELQCLYVYIIPLITYFPNMEGVAHRNENCNVCMCILFPWSPISPIFPTWRGCSQQWEFQCIYVYYSLDHLFSRHGEGCWEKWELQCLYVYIIPLITYFPNMDGLLTAMRIPMYICILFPWSPIFPTWRGLLTEMRIAMSVCVYYSLDHLFPQTWRGLLTEMRIAMYVYMYISPTFPLHVCMCILFPWFFPNMEGLLTEMRIAMSVCVYYSLDHLFPQTWRGLLTEMRIAMLTEMREIRIAMSVCVYYSLDHLFPQTWRGLLTEMRIAMYVCILFPWSPISPTWRGLLREMRIAMSVCVYYSFDHLFPQTWRGLLTEMRIAMSVCVYYSLDHLFSQTWRGCSQKWELQCIYTYFPDMEGVADLQCLYVYIIPLITYFPNMDG